MSEIIGFKIVIDGQEKTLKSVGEIRALLKEAQFNAIALSQQFGETSKEALDAAQKVAMMKDQIKDTDERIGLFDPGKKFQVFSNAISATAGGFAALQGAMGLFGAESENVQKSLLKVQSALALSQGLSTITDAEKDFKRLAAQIQQTTLFTKANELANKATTISMRALGISAEVTSVSFKVLKTAIVSTGIGVLVIALGEAISAFQNYSSAAEKAAKSQADFNKKIQEGAKIALDSELKNIENQTKLLVAKAKAVGKSEDEIFKIEQDGRRLKAEALQRYYLNVKDADKKAASEAASDLQNVNNDALIAIENHNEAKRKKKEEDAKKEKEKALERQLEIEAAQKEALDKEYKNELDAYNKRKALRGKEQQENIDAYATLSQQRAEQKAAEDKKAKDDADLLEQMRSSALGKMIEKNIAAGAAIVKTNEDTAKANVKIGEKEADAKTKSIEAVKLAITNLSMIAGKETVAGKALAIAASIINTYQGITAALKSAPVPFNFISAAAVGAAGFAAVKNIVSVQVPGSSGSGGASVPSAPNLNAGSPLNPSTIAANQVTLDQRSINAMGNRAIKAYVVETEISSAQQKIRRIQKQTTFG